MSFFTSYYRLHFSRRHQVVALISNLFANTTYTARHGLIKGMKRRGGLGFLPSFLVPTDNQTPELLFLSKLNIKNLVVYDIGAFQGVLSLFFSKSARHVVAYEANPRNFKRVLENIELNGIRNITVRNLAAGDRDGSVALVFDRVMTGAGSCDPRISEQIKSGQHSESVSVSMVRVDDDIRLHGLPPPQLIKLDIEGAELAALHGLRQTLEQYRPALYIEMHGATEDEKIANARQLVDFLLATGYSQILHVESRCTITSDNASNAREGHIYCTAA
jgi:FkbM family methyltransferase